MTQAEKENAITDTLKDLMDRLDVPGTLKITGYGTTLTAKAEHNVVSKAPTSPIQNPTEEAKEHQKFTCEPSKTMQKEAKS